ncbi:MAG TPA: hypothetical protein ENF95_00110 [Candidatus Aenigmarchaeota archaeon]|nr:hypothetical protein [Candidatus Aenigmarchaeota archaeon]
MFRGEEFNKFALENAVEIKNVPITLKSGRKSHFYVNWRFNDVFLVDKLSNYVIEFADEYEILPTCFYPVPEGATKLGIITQYKYAILSSRYEKGSHPLPMGRGKPKEHGDVKDRYFIGEPKGRVVVLEDVTTTGLSILETVKNLKDLDCEIIGVMSLTNRMEKTPIPGKDDRKVVKRFKDVFEDVTGEKYTEPMAVDEALIEAGIPYYSLSTARDLIPLAIKKFKPSEEVVRSIEREIEEYGIEPISLK